MTRFNGIENPVPCTSIDKRTTVKIIIFKSFLHVYTKVHARSNKNVWVLKIVECIVQYVETVTFMVYVWFNAEKWCWKVIDQKIKSSRLVRRHWSHMTTHRSRAFDIFEFSGLFSFQISRLPHSLVINSSTSTPYVICTSDRLIREAFRGTESLFCAARTSSSSREESSGPPR